MTHMWRPITMTTLTTIAGFLGLYLASVMPPMKYFGLFAMTGVGAAWLYSVTVLPAWLSMLKLRPSPAYRPTPEPGVVRMDAFGRAMTAFGHIVVRHPGWVLWTSGLVAIVGVYGALHLELNESRIRVFQKDEPIVLADRAINQRFDGAHYLDIMIETPKTEDIFKLENLKRIEAFQDYLETLPHVGGSTSVVDYLKQMNRSLNEGRADAYILPNNKDLIAQYLLLYEISGDPENLWKVVDNQYQEANLTFQLKSDNSKAINSALEVIKSYEDRFKYLGVTLGYAGSGYTSLVFTDLILEGQVTSLIISLILVIALLALMFKDLTLGIIGAIPIAITAIISFGVMGLLGIPLSTTTALVSSIAIGIGIDYAVHFIERYKVNALKTKDLDLTIGKTMQHSGRAISFNALVVIAGFLVLLFSVFPPNRALGALVSLNMFTSFLGTVTVMFLILVQTKKFFKPKK